MSGEVIEYSERTSYLSSEERFSLIIMGRLSDRTPKLRMLWAIAWVFIGLAVAYEAKRLVVDQEARMILLVFMSFWAYYLYRIVKAIRWHQVGKEMLMMKGDSLVHKNSFGEIGKSRKYHLANVIPIKKREKTEGWGSLFEDSFWSIGRGSLELSVDGKILFIGIRLDEKESNKVMTLFNKELKKRQQSID